MTRPPRSENGGKTIRLLSIIIPALDEEGLLPGTLRSVGKHSDTEVVVVDGGSTDRTVEIARTAGARVLVSTTGRAGQMNAGARAASGDTLLFLHADTALPAGYRKQIEAMLGTPGVVAGGFRLGFDDDRRSLRAIAWGANLRSRWRQLPYGDQALFLRKPVFVEIGGFRELPVMEDYDFVCRLRRRGRIALAPGSVTTSSRRWLSRGTVRTTLVHQCLLLGWRLGFSAERLAGWYRRLK